MRMTVTELRITIWGSMRDDVSHQQSNISHMHGTIPKPSELPTEGASESIIGSDKDGECQLSLTDFKINQ